MTHDELLAKLDVYAPSKVPMEFHKPYLLGLRAVVELHKPYKRRKTLCRHCVDREGDPKSYPCPTIQAIEKELA